MADGEDLEGENRRLARMRLGALDGEDVLRDQLKTVDRHLANGAGAQRDLRRGRDAHVFFDGADLALLEHAVWMFGIELREHIRDWKRFWLKFDCPIGERVQRGRLPLPL